MPSVKELWHARHAWLAEPAFAAWPTAGFAPQAEAMDNSKIKKTRDKRFMGTPRKTGL
jgi:hypothetical protein